MKSIRVVAAVIKKVNEKGETIIFATQRGYGDFVGGWSFLVERLRMVKRRRRPWFVK